MILIYNIYGVKEGKSYITLIGFQKIFDNTRLLFVIKILKNTRSRRDLNLIKANY